MDFANKVVIITGASSGIGAACAIEFAKLSAKLSLIGRNIPNLQKTVQECENISSFKPLSIIADISNDAEIEKIIKETLNCFGHIDVLVNNAGMSLHAPLENISVYDTIMNTNVRGTYLLTAKALPYLVKTKGNIINLSSILSNKAVSSIAPYCMSKAAIDMFTKCIALGYGSKGVRANSVNPGPVKTEIFKRAGMTESDNEKLFDELQGASPLKKITKAQDVAELVVFLASAKASCITGCNYVIDCGLVLGAEK